MEATCQIEPVLPPSGVDTELQAAVRVTGDTSIYPTVCVCVSRGESVLLYTVCVSWLRSLKDSMNPL